jgi:6-pyruvoyltetrahydropterin/6-carboxytetrahydropterin synthase
MGYSITKRFDFSASHQLNGLPPEHQCARLHGHNYSVLVTIESDALDSVGFVWDYANLSAAKAWLDETFDHRHLNDRMSDNPTAENLARFIHEHLSLKVLDLPAGVTVGSIVVKETPKTSAVYHP